MSVSIFSLIIVLGVLIFFHELGHFLVARLLGVGVERFSLGFGPKLVGKKIGITEYRISAIPLGGYVKMVGESPDSELD
jgi:regulator of sigma E protease